MKREIRDIIENDVVIPDIVLQAKEEAFAKIPDTDASKEMTDVALVKKTGKRFKKKWVVVAMVAVLAVGTLSVGATSGFSWYEKIQEAMFITDSEKNTVDKYGLGSEPNLAVTDKGVTVAVEQTIFDSRAFFVVLSIDGVEAPTKENSAITFWDFDISTIPNAEFYNYGGEYIGVDAETGKVLYLWEGSLPVDANMLILDLGEMNAEEPADDAEGIILNELWRVDGNWRLEIPVEYNNVAIEGVYTDKPIYSGAELLRVRMTPLAIEMEWSERIALNVFYGFLMKDGTINRASHGGTLTGDAQCGGVTEQTNYGTVVNIEEVEAILMYDVETENIDYDNPTVDDFIVVPLPE